MNDALKITRYKDLEKHLTDLGYEMPETIDGLHTGYCIIKTLHEQNLIK